MNRQGFRLHAGTASILLVFVTLCLIAFAVLSLSSANADLRLSQKIAERNTLYYAAHNEAVQMLAETDEALLALAKDAPDEDTFLTRVRERFGSERFTAAFPISERQDLRVEALAVWGKSPAADTEDASLANGVQPRFLVIKRFQVETKEEVLQSDVLEIEEATLNLPH